MKRRTQLPTRKLNQASINFIYLRLVTANNLCKVFQTSTKSKLGKSSWDGGATNLFPAAADAFAVPPVHPPSPAHSGAATSTPLAGRNPPRHHVCIAHSCLEKVFLTLPFPLCSPSLAAPCEGLGGLQSPPFGAGSPCMTEAGD